MNVFEQIKEKCLKNSQIGRSSFAEFLKILDEVEKEQSNGWVPCSERLPEKKGDYLVTCNDGKVRVWWFVVADDFKCWLEGVGNLKPIAWMPLPEPYKEDEEQ